MNKILKVIKPFSVMEVGDTLEYSESTKMYTSQIEVNNSEADDKNNSYTSKYTSTYSISKEYAEYLIKEGYLSDVDENVGSNFVNVFDEIERLGEMYQNQLETLDDDMAAQPECLKVEKTTVLNNLLEVLSYLRSLKR